MNEFISQSVSECLQSWSGFAMARSIFDENIFWQKPIIAGKNYFLPVRFYHGKKSGVSTVWHKPTNLACDTLWHLVTDARERFVSKI